MSNIGFKETNKVKILVCNIIIAVCCVASILTLILGDFMRTDVTLTVDKAKLTKMVDGGSASSAPVGIKATSESESGIKEMLQYIPDDFKLSFTVTVQVEAKSVAKTAFSPTNTENSVRELIGKQVDNLVNEMEKKVDEVVQVGIEAIIRMAADRAKKAIRESLEEDGSTVTEEEINAKLREKGIENYEQAIDNLVEEIKAPIDALMAGDQDAIRDFINQKDDNATLYKFIKIAAEEELKNGDPAIPNPTEQQIEDKANEHIDDLISKYDEFVKEFSDSDGTLNARTMIIALLKKANLIDDDQTSSPSNADAEESGSGEINSLDDVKNFVIEKIYGAINEDTVRYIGIAMVFFGYFLLFIMLCWAYVLIKVIFKGFIQKKTVGLFFPRMFGWIPHVLFVGVPLLIIKLMPEIMSRLSPESAAEFQKYMDMISVNFTSLTWVSALCTVILMIVLFVYYPERRQEKRNKKAGGSASQQVDFFSQG